jgi:1-aminocyclopropane-1-carboxylate deaminase/D-cysteine desulfhydrase-like pyridoxal-dependent ACC family enzyme
LWRKNNEYSLDKFLNIADLPVTNINDALIVERGLSLGILRLDLIHPIISGNKLFKLKYYVEKAEAERKDVLTFGGAFSNHLVATAYYCKLLNIKCKGIVRGERTILLSPTLLKCETYGMHLEFVNRNQYSEISSTLEASDSQVIIPEGGFGKLGVKGAAEIMQHQAIGEATHLAISVGSATTLAGLLLANHNNLELIAVPAIKNMQDIPERLQKLIGRKDFVMPTIFNEYHFGGFAKIDEELISFMNKFYQDHKIPTDRIYTSKLLFTIMKKVKEGYFPKGSKIIAIHTGGLQGNVSLTNNELIF